VRNPRPRRWPRPERQNAAALAYEAVNLPEPPASSFASDNAAGVAPAVMAALVEANTGPALAYGDDRWTAQLVERFRDLFAAPVEVVLCWGGTGANVVGLASMLQPWQAVVCHENAHIVTDECGAPARFTGSMMLTTRSADGKVDVAAIGERAAWSGDVHHPQPAVVSISQTTEWGTVYRVDEIAALADAAHAAGMLLHLDGARIANAVAAVGTDLVAMIRDTGVDVMTFGVTKNGAMYGEAVIYLRPDLASAARFHHKQAAQLPSKARFIAAQILALLEDDLWLVNARHANAMAQRLVEEVRGIPGVEIVNVPEANAVFAMLPQDLIEPLQNWSFCWSRSDRPLVRWMTSFATTDDDVLRFATGLRALAEDLASRR
jgi:threonine aldolase